MPMDPTRYPSNWREFSYAIRFTRALGQCECTGQCGLHQPNPTTRRCTERHHTAAKWFKGVVRLTTAHICKCDPPCAIPEHVRACCQRCHLRIDREQHARTRAATILAKQRRHSALPETLV